VPPSVRSAWLAVALASLAAPPSPARASDATEPVPELLTTALSMQRVALPEGLSSPTLEVDTLKRRVSLRVAAPDVARTVAALRAAKSPLCRRVEAVGLEVRLTCRTPRIEALLTRQGPRTWLELRELRGLPLAGPDVLPRLHYPPERMALGAPCPGSTAAGRAECLLAEGKVEEARELFESARTSAHRPFAFLRLGDLALEAGDASAAAPLYFRAGVAGYPGRLATLRLCALTGVCTAADRAAKALDVARLPEPVRTEVELIEVRRAAYLGLPGRAAQLLLERLMDPKRELACVGPTWPFCRHVMLWAMRDEEVDERSAALIAYVALPSGAWQQTDVELVSAASDLAAELGAPLFAAQVRASVTRAVPPAQLEAHLLRTLQLYLQAGERARAQVILEYARTRLPPARLAARQWSDVLGPARPASRSADAHPRAPALAPPAQAALEEALGRALEAARKARDALAELPAPAGTPLATDETP
jgi:tetratricopeptide (TPR) repeat protein